jgi:hypothetical protein
MEQKKILQPVLSYAGDIKFKINPGQQFAVWLTLIFCIVSCTRSPKTTEKISLNLPPEPQPKGYVCYRTTTPVIPDGLLDEKAWAEVPWTDYFVDIEGLSKPVARFKTHAKMLWDDKNFYIAAELEEPDVWATLRQRDTVIFFDPDFEVFIDPDGDTHTYYELEVNPLGTAWDLLMVKPYRDGSPAVVGWDIAGLKVGTHVDGTINKPGDKDKGWTVEIIIPLASLTEYAWGASIPKAGDQWRLNFYRIEWRTVSEKGKYKKEINPATGKTYLPDQWVWSPPNRNDIHMPEMFEFVQFSSLPAGEGTEAFVPDPDFNLKWALRKIHYAEKEFFTKNNTFSSSLSDIGLTLADFPKNLPAPVIQATQTTFESYFPDSKSELLWTIYHDGRIIRISHLLKSKEKL